MRRRCKRQRDTVARVLAWQAFEEPGHARCRLRLIEMRVHRPMHRRAALHKQRRVAMFIDGRLLQGHATAHRTARARLWRLRLRLKRLTRGGRP